MINIQDVPSALEAIRQWEIAHYGSLPDEVKPVMDRVAQNNLSPVDRIVFTAEAIYADAGKINDAGKQLAAGLISFAASMGWHALNTGRGAALIAFLSGEADEGPEPLAQFVRAPAPPAPVG